MKEFKIKNPINENDQEFDLFYDGMYKDCYQGLLYLEDIFVGVTFYNNGRFLPYTFMIPKASTEVAIEKDTGIIRATANSWFKFDLPDFPEIKFQIYETLYRYFQKAFKHFVNGTNSGYNESKIQWNYVTFEPVRFELESRSNVTITFMNHVKGYVSINDEIVKKYAESNLEEIDKAVEKVQLDLPFEN